MRQLLKLQDTNHYQATTRKGCLRTLNIRSLYDIENSSRVKIRESMVEDLNNLLTI